MAAARGRQDLRVRDARPVDLPAIRDIYAHHVLHGVASFEETPPDVAEMTRRYEAILERGLPYLVAEAASSGAGSEVQGYAYAGPYRPRPAYRYTVENSVYVAPGLEGRGIGRSLLEELIPRCVELGLRQMVAVISGNGELPSVRFHQHMGFSQIGTLRAAGFKFGDWVDVVIMQRPLGAGDGTLPDGPPPFTET